MKYVVSKSQLEEFFIKLLDVRDENQKRIYLKVIDLAEEIFAYPPNVDSIIELISDHMDDVNILWICKKLQDRIDENQNRKEIL